MTQKEINKFLADTKVYVNDKSKEIQEKLFSLGYRWIDGDRYVCYTNSPFLFIYKDKSFSRADSMESFSNNDNREICAEEILSIKLTKPKYKPFNNKEDCWNEMLKHQPFGWVKYKNDGANLHISCVMGKVYIGDLESYSFKDFFSSYTFADGTPFGIKVE